MSKGNNVDACRKCNNANLVLNGPWRQCASCGEVHEKRPDIPLSRKNTLDDIISRSFKSTFMGRLISKLRLIR
jgi:uncharacterized Zn finger protein